MDDQDTKPLLAQPSPLAPKLPQNAKRNLQPVSILRPAKNTYSPHTPSSVRSTHSLARATELLASQPSRQLSASLPRTHALDPGATTPRSTDSSSVLDSGEITRRLHRHLVTRPKAASSSEELADPLTLPSGDMTREIYRWQEEPIISRQRGHRRSVSDTDHGSDSEWDIGFTHRQINVPGGFRRQFVRAQNGCTDRANPVTQSFVDFLALYGHLADECHPDDSEDGSEFGETRALIEPRAEASASQAKAFFLLIKAFVGTGVLVLPRAFYNGGLLTSCIVMVVVAAYAWHCIVLLSRTYLKVSGSYSDIGYMLYGRWAQLAVMTSIVVAQIGGCCAYTIFVASNLRNVWNTVTSCRMSLSMEFWVLIQLVAYIPLALVRKIKNFATVALLANILIISSLAYLLAYDTWAIADRGTRHVVQFNPERFPLLIGTAVYSFEGITLCIPIVDAMREKHAFTRTLSAAIVCCIVLFLGVGSLSYLTFGEHVESAVLLNLPSGEPPTIVVQLLYSIAILCSTPIQLFPAVRIVEDSVFVRSGRNSFATKWTKNAFRSAMVMLIVVIAMVGVEQLDNVVAIVGSFALVPLSFIYPSIFHMRAVATSPNERAKDALLAGVGVVAMVYVTWIGVASWGTGEPPLDICASPPTL